MLLEYLRMVLSRGLVFEYEAQFPQILSITITTGTAGASCTESEAFRSSLARGTLVTKGAWPGPRQSFNSHQLVLAWGRAIPAIKAGKGKTSKYHEIPADLRSNEMKRFESKLPGTAQHRKAFPHT